MNDRVMQFRIGMFVIVAGLVLVMMIIWFGETPSILQSLEYVRVHYVEAPGVGEGTPVRRSGIKIGEVKTIGFDDRPDQPEGVILLLSIDKAKAKLRVGSVPKINRTLLGDVTIDMTPATGTDPLPTSDVASRAPLIEGEMAPDPSRALAAATQAIEKVGGTLVAIEDAAKGLTSVAKKAQDLDKFLATWTGTGENLKAAGGRIDALLKENAADIKPTIVGLRSAVERLDRTLDDQTAADLQSAIRRINSAGGRLDAGLADLKPFLADLGAGVNDTPTTNFGQTLWRANRIATDLMLLTRTLSDGQGGLNTRGSIQQLFVNPALYDNWNKVSTSAVDLINSLKPVAASMRTLVDRVNRDPGVLTRGALQRQ